MLYRRGFGVTFSGLAFVTSLISIINLRPDAPPQNFLHTTERRGAPQKCFKSGPALANAGPDRKLWGIRTPIVFNVYLTIFCLI